MHCELLVDKAKGEIGQSHSMNIRACSVERTGITFLVNTEGFLQPLDRLN